MVDEKQVVYSKESIVDITTDSTTSTFGTVDISGGQITLGPQSSVSYEYNYEAGQDSSIITDILQLDCSIIGLTTGMTTRYNRYLSVLIKVQYYLEIVEGETKTYYDGNTDTFEIYPYLSHESNNTLYNIALQNSYIKKITITYKNNYSNDSVKYTNIKLKYSMSLLEAIDKYGGGSPSVPGSNSLKFYSVDDKYSIDNYGDSLIMKIDIDESNWEEVVKPYIKHTESITRVSTHYYNKNGINYSFELYNPVMIYTADIRWTVRGKSDVKWAFSADVYGSEQIMYIKEARDLSDEEKARLSSETGSVYDREYNRILNSGDCWSELKVNIKSRYCKIIGYKTETLVVRAEYIDAPNIYFEQEVKINNCSVVDFKLTFDDNDMEIHGSDIQFATLEIIPSNVIKDEHSKTAANLSCISYDEMGGIARFVGDDGSENNSVDYSTLPARVKIKGRNNGKVLFTAKTVGLFPEGFSKSWIAEVFDTTDFTDLYTRTPNGKVIDATKEYIDIIVGTNRNYKLGHYYSNYGLESLDGVGQGYITKLTNYDNKELTYRIYTLTPGKIKFWGEMSAYVSGSYIYVGRVEVDITALYKELTTEITTNTGLFEITQGGGQLEVHCTPNYSYAGRYSFSQVSIDGGSVSIDDKGDYALITADKEGRLNLICKPDRGNPVQCEISVSNQYPKDVKLTCADNIFKVPINGTLMIYAEASNKPNSNYDKYEWIGEKLDSDVNWVTTTWDKYAKYKGLNLGKLRVSVQRKVDSKFMASQVVKVVQSLDSDKTVLPYPNSQQYWVVYRRTDQDNRLWLLTIDGTVTLNKLIKKNDNRLYTDNITLGAFAQWKIESGQWANHNSWSGDTNHVGSVGQLYASNLDIYDESGNLLVAKTDSYDDVDFDAIIYGQDVYLRRAVELKTSKDTVYTDTEVKVKALNSDDTVAYDWQFVGTDVTVVEKTNRYVIFKSTSSGNLKVNYILSESGNIITGTDLKVIDKPTNLKYIRLYITKAYRNSNTVGYCNMSELDILDSNGDSVLTDGCVYTADSVYSGSSDVPANAFDKNTSTIWHSDDNSNAHWIQIEFASGIDLPSSYVITRRTDNWNDYLASWELQASTDGSTWLTLDKHTDDTNWSSGYSRTFSIQ